MKCHIALFHSGGTDWTFLGWDFMVHTGEPRKLTLLLQSALQAASIPIAKIYECGSQQITHRLISPPPPMSMDGHSGERTGRQPIGRLAPRLEAVDCRSFLSLKRPADCKIEGNRIRSSDEVSKVKEPRALHGKGTCDSQGTHSFHCYLCGCNLHQQPEPAWNINPSSSQ